jgi:MFS family permease
MDAHEASAGLLAKRTRMDFGWGLAKFAWRLARGNRVMLGLGFPAALLLSAAGIANANLASPKHHGSVFGLALVLVAGMVGGLFFQTALAFAADGAIDGDRLSWRDALAEARWRFPAVLGWAMIATAVGLLLALGLYVQRLGFTAWLAGIAWSFATVFVVPMLALDLANPLEAMREAPHLLRDRWGEEMAGIFGIGAILILAWIPGGILIGVGNSHNHADPGSGTLPVLVGALLVVLTLGFAVATFQTFAVALYRDATVGFPDPHAFVWRRPKRKSWVVRIGTVILVGVLTLGLIFSIAGPRPKPKEFHTGFPARYAIAISAGMPVVYRDEQVGEVQRSEISGDEDIVWFTVDAEHRALQSSSSVTLSFFSGRPCLAIVQAGERPPGSDSGASSASSF